MHDMSEKIQEGATNLKNQLARAKSEERKKIDAFSEKIATIEDEKSAAVEAVEKQSKSKMDQLAVDYNKINDELTALTVDIYEINFEYKQNNLTTFERFGSYIGEVKKSEKIQNPETSVDPLKDIAERSRALEFIMINSSDTDMKLRAYKLIQELNAIKAKFEDLEKQKKQVEQELQENIHRVSDTLDKAIDGVEMIISKVQSRIKTLERSMVELDRFRASAEDIKKKNVKVIGEKISDNAKLVSIFVILKSRDELEKALNSVSTPDAARLAITVSRTFRKAKAGQVDELLLGLMSVTDTQAVKQLTQDVRSTLVKLEEVAKGSHPVAKSIRQFREKLDTIDSSLQDSLKTQYRVDIDKKLDKDAFREYKSSVYQDKIKEFTTPRPRSANAKAELPEPPEPKPGSQ